MTQRENNANAEKMPGSARPPHVAVGRRHEPRRAGHGRRCRAWRACSRPKQKQPGISRDFSVILFWANGGPSHIDLFDLKPDAPVEYRGPFRPIRTNVPGIEINEHLPRLAELADKFAIVRSLHHERGEHSGGTHRFLTGYPSQAANLNDAEFPDVGSVVAHQLATASSPVPLFVANTQFVRRRAGLSGPGVRAVHAQPEPDFRHRRQPVRPGADLPHGRTRTTTCRSPPTACCR